MSLKMTSAVRQGTGCNHYVITAIDNGVTKTTKISVDELNALFDFFPGDYRGAQLFSWVRDRMNRGATLQQCVNVEIESVI